MIRRMTIGFLAASVLGASALLAEDAPKPPDLNGTWKLDPARSTMPQRPDGGQRGARAGGEGGRGGGGWPGGSGGGGWSGGSGRHGWGRGRGDDGASNSSSGGDRDARAMARPPRMPALMHITETATIVSVEDSSGAVVQEIATVPPAADTLAQAPGAQHVLGAWKGDTLVVERYADNGMKTIQKISLEDKGKSLVIDTKIEMDEKSPVREFKRVYARVEGS